MASKKPKRAKVRKAKGKRVSKRAPAKGKVKRPAAKRMAKPAQGPKKRVRQQLSGTVAPDVAEGMLRIAAQEKSPLSLILEMACRDFLAKDAEIAAAGRTLTRAAEVIGSAFGVARKAPTEPESTIACATPTAGLRFTLPSGEDVLSFTKAEVVFAEGHGEHGLGRELLAWAKAWLAEEVPGGASLRAAAPEPPPPSSVPPPLGRCPRCKTRGPVGPCSTARCNGERRQ